MGLLHNAVDTVMHLDKSLSHAIGDYGAWTYLILFAIVFCETGLVVTPFLPGDSLLFAAGAITAVDGRLSFSALVCVLLAGVFCGDNCNYWIGKLLGPRLFRSENSKVLNRDHLARTHAFFDRYGGKTIVLARFVPIVRTYVPFVAGLGAMAYGRFLVYSVCAAALWVGVCTGAGRLFGNIPFVKGHFSLIVLAIVVISVLPGVFEYVKHRRGRTG